jgi:hypothetical protein
MFGRVMLGIMLIGGFGAVAVSYSNIEKNPQFVSQPLQATSQQVAVEKVLLPTVAPSVTPSAPTVVNVTPPVAKTEVTQLPVAATPKAQPIPKPPAKTTQVAVPIPTQKPLDPNHKKGANDCVTNKPSPGIGYNEFKALMDNFNQNPGNPNVCNFVQIKQAIGEELFTTHYQVYRKEKGFN